MSGGDQQKAGNIIFVCVLIAAACIGALFALADNARGNDYGYGSGYTTQRSAYPAYDGWRYSTWHRNGSYFVRTRWVKHSPHTNWVGEDDGWLYTLQNGQYCKHSKIADYRDPVAKAVEHKSNDNYERHSDVLGDVRVGISDIRKHIAKVHSGLARVAELRQERQYDLRQFLPDPETEAAARRATEERKHELAVKSSERIALADIDRERQNDAARHIIAREATRLEALERALSTAQRETVAAFERTLLASSEDVAEGGIRLDIADEGLEQDIRTTCYSCHGGSQDAGTSLDFNNIDAVKWSAVLTRVATGNMPKGGEKWGNDQLKRLQDYIDNRSAK